jgi:3-hydroxyisobutyrate dehydrogenase-like beta-hydroxyacid dehydrogenase
MEIGFIGLGNLGSVLVNNLIESNRKTHLYNRTEEKMKPYKDKAVLHTKVASIAASCDILISALTDDEAVESICYGQGGIIENIKPNAVHVCLSTIASSTASSLHHAHRKKNIEYITATIIGRPEAAAARLLTACLSGISEKTNLVVGILKDLGVKSIYHFGDDPAAAAVIKICNNFLLTAAMEAMSEAFSLAKKSGADTAIFYRMITETLFGSPAYKKYAKIIVDEDYGEAGAASYLGLKDTRLALKLADELSATLPIGDILKNHFIMNHNRGRINDDWTTMAKVISENNN